MLHGHPNIKQTGHKKIKSRWQLEQFEQVPGNWTYEHLRTQYFWTFLGQSSNPCRFLAVSVSCDCSRIVDIAQIEGPLTEWLSQFIPVVLDHFSFQGTTPWSQGLDCPAMLDHFKSSRKVQTNDLCQCFALCFRSTHQLWSVQPSLCKTHPVFWTLWEPQTVKVSKTKKTSSCKSPCENRKSRAARRERNQVKMDFLGIDMVFRWIYVEKTWKNMIFLGNLPTRSPIEPPPTGRPIAKIRID